MTTNTNKTPTGIIIAAGNQERFKSNMPKFLMPYKDTNVLKINIQYMQNHCDRVYVFTNFKNYYKVATMTRCMQNVEVIYIYSGNGCGDAVIQSLLTLKHIKNAIIKWGDAIHDDDAYYNCFDYNNNSVQIPAEYTKNPYTSIIANDKNIIQDINFNNNKNEYGWHDLSIFYIGDVKSFINQNKNWSVTKQPVIFLKELVNYKNDAVLIKTKLISKSFNTLSEYKSIVNKKGKL